MLTAPLEYVAKICNMFKTYGIKSVTMDDIARELGISKKTLYTHFKDKSDVVGTVLEKDWREKTLELNVAMADNSNAIQEIFEFYKILISNVANSRPNFLYDLKKYYPEHFDKFTGKKKAIMVKSFKKNLIRGKKEGLFRSDINEEIVTKIHMGRIDAATNFDVFKSEELHSPEFFTEAFKYHLYAIVSDKGREIIKKEIDNIIANA